MLTPAGSATDQNQAEVGVGFEVEVQMQSSRNGVWSVEGRRRGQVVERDRRLRTKVDGDVCVKWQERKKRRWLWRRRQRRQLEAWLFGSIRRQARAGEQAAEGER